MPIKTYTNTTTTTTKKSNKSDSSSSSSKNHCPCFTCKGKPQPTWQDVGDKRWYCKSCWDEYEAEVVGKKKEKNPAAATSRNVCRQAPKKDKKKNKKDKPARAEKKQSPKKKEKKVKTGEKKRKPTAEKRVPAKRREEELAWESLEELAREASRMRDLTSLSKKKKPSSVTVPTPDSTNTATPITESKTSDTPPLWCHPDIAKTREQICVNKNWMAHSKKAMYRSALESVAQAAKDLYTPPPPPAAPPAPPVATTTTSTSTTTSGPVPDDNNTATTTNDSNKKQKKNKKRKSKSKSGAQYVPFPVESLAFLPSLVHAVESPKGASAPEVESLLKSFLEKAWDQEIIQKEKQAVEEVMKKLREEQAAKLKEKIARKEAAEKEAAAARALAQAESTPAKNDDDAELPTTSKTPAEPVNTVPAEGEQPVVATASAEKKKKSKKPKMPKITEHMINRALPSEVQQARSQRLSFMNQLQTYVRIITRTGVSLSVGITALYIVYSKCSSHDLYALLIRFQEHFQRCAPAQNQAVSYVVNLAGSIVVNNNIPTASSSSATTASVESPHDSLLRAKEKLQAIFEEYMDDHKERAIKSAIVEPSEFIGYCSGDSSAADHVEANGRWVYLTAVVEGLGGGSDRVKEGTSEFQLPLPVLQGEDQYQIGTHFAWDAIREDEAAAFKDPLHFGMSGFRNVKLLKDRAAPEEERRAKKQCRDYRYQSDKGGIGNLREMFQVEKPESEYDQELKLWAKNIDAFAYFFSKDFFIKRCFETLNTESRPEYAGFRTACFTVFKHYLLATSAAATSEDATCIKQEEITESSSLSIEDQLYEYCYSDEYCTELNVDSVFKFFQWLGIAKQEKSEIAPAVMNQEEGDCKCGLECYLDELAAKEEKIRLEQEQEQKQKQQQQVEVGKEEEEEEEEGYGETKQQRRQDELDGRRHRVSRFQKNKYQSEPEQSTNTNTVQTKKQEEEVAPPPMLIDDGFAMSKTKSFEIEPEPPLFVCSP